MNRRPLLKFVSLLIVLVYSFNLRSQTSTPVQYFYDDLGRLVKVVDPSGNSATYTYDAVGNILKITRATVAATGTSVLAFTPQRGITGTTVTIQGQGFSTTTSQNAVSFNGAAATVVSSTATSIIATVPATATTGPISVTVGGQTATSDTNFVIVPSPAVTAISPKAVLESSSSPTVVSVSVTGTNLGAAIFTLQPASNPPTVNVISANVNAAGTTATLSVTILPNTTGTFTLVAAGPGGSSSNVSSSANTLHILDPNADDDHDGLTNAVELALGTDPLNPSTVGDGITDGWKVFYGFNPLDNTVAGQDNDGDGLTNLQEFQQGTSPRDPDRVAPSVAQISPANTAANIPLNGRIIVRFGEALLTGVSLTSAQNAIQSAAPGLSSSTQTAASIALQSYLQGACCGNSVVPGVVSVLQGATPIAGSFGISDDGLSVTFIPAQALSASTAYTVQVNNVRDTAGNRMTQQFQSAFTSGTTTDNTLPSVVRTSPAPSYTNVPTNAAITVQFSKPMDPSTVTSQNFTVLDTSRNVTVPGAVQVDASGLTAAFIPNPLLGIGTNFTATLNTSVKDSSGNGLTSAFSLAFTTSFVPDNDVPHLLASSPASSATNVPTNSLIVLEFNEPVNLVGAITAVQVSAGGQPVLGSIALSDAERRVTFTPVAALPSNSVITVTVGPSLTDLADRLIDNPGSFTFQTGNATDNSTPAVATVSPSNGAGNVPGNTVVELQFSKAIDPLTVTSATLQLIPGTIGGSGSVTAGGNPIAGTVTVSSNGLSATFIPASPLVLGTSYVVEATPGVSDLEGHGLASFASAFITGVSSSGAGLAVQRISPQNGDTSVPVNVLVVARFNSPIEPLSVGSGAIAVSTGSVNVAGTVQLMSDRMGLVFTPNSPLSANTAYSVAVSGFADATGTVVTPFTSSFTTRSSTASDSGNPQVVSVSPTNGATGVAVNSNVVLTFNENVAATSVSASTVQVNVAGGSGSVAGSYAVAGPVVTFTPLSPLPAAASMQVVVTQLESEATVNTPPPSSNTFSSSFTTTGGTDTAVPSVLSVSPVNGATNIGLNATAVVTFSKSLNPGTIGGNTFALYANGAVLGSTIAVSADNRTVTLTPTSTLPASSTVTVIVTSGVRDFYGNALSDFRSQFTTAPNFDVISARVASQRPASGASGVPLGSSIVLFVNEPLSQATIANSLHVSQNGVIGQGTTTSRDNGQTIEFVPTAPWLNNALVQVFLDSTAIDTDGTPVVAYQGSFRTALDTTSTAPTVVAISPPDGLPAASVARNAVIDVQYNEPLDPGTVGTNTVLLQNDTANKAIEGTVFLDPTGTIARLVPTIPLDAGSHYHVSTTVGILGLNGLSQAAAFNSLGFSTASTTDTTAPTIALVSPPDGSLGVPVNANIRVRFSKQIDVLTANASNIQISGGGQTVTATSISFSNNNQDVLITPQEPFPDNTQMAITVSGVNDLAGNPVVAQTTRFTTGAVPAAVAPVVVAANPSSGELGVSVNAVIAIQTNVPVDAGSLTSLSMVVNDTSTSLPISGTTNVSADGKTVSFIPGAPLATFHTYQVLASSGIADFAGNQLSCPSLQLCSFSFTTAVSSTNGALAVTGVSPANGQTQVPINAQVMAQFSVPVNPLTLGQVTLTSTGGATQVSTQLINGNQTLLLFPLQPLTAGTSYTVTVAGAQDEAGNTLSPSFSSSFSTANGADLTGPPLVVSVTPFNNAQGAPVNTAIQLQFNKPVNRLTVTSASFQLLTQTGTSVNSAITFSPDGTIAILTPTSNLAFSTTYSVQTTSAIIGLTGQSLAPFTSRFTTASSAPAFNVVAVGPANLATGVAVNDLVSLLLSESVNGSSVGSNAIVVSTGGTPITGSIVLSTDRTGLTFTPTIPLAVNATYSVSASGFNDLSGNAIPAFNSSFTTGGSSVPDTTAPTVVSVSPVNGATGISAGAAIVLTFSKSIGPGSVNSSTVAVTVNGNPIAGSFAVSGSTVTFTPRLLLPSGAAINVSVSNVQDLAGNVTATFSSSFRTSGGGGGAS